jgi:hypothetical protein
MVSTSEDDVWPWPEGLDAVVAAPDSHRVVFENEIPRRTSTRSRTRPCASSSSRPDGRCVGGARSGLAREPGSWVRGVRAVPTGRSSAEPDRTARPTDRASPVHLRCQVDDVKLPLGTREKRREEAEALRVPESHERRMRGIAVCKVPVTIAPSPSRSARGRALGGRGRRR